MERAIKDLPRDPEIVDLFKKLNAAGSAAGTMIRAGFKSFKKFKPFIRIKRIANAIGGQ